MEKFIRHLALNPRRLFLIDGLGAVLSAFSLGVVLTTFEQHFGMPRELLYILAFIPCVFAVYSFFCAYKFKENWQPFMKFIAIANLVYCLMTTVLLFQHFEQLTALGVSYFLLELLIVISLSSIELMAASRRNF